ncbi:potassium voltage-gated channel protein egl-36-like [Babylonia areolata]|uniref:potassium voltage-gated channel protein egl-36-like n=1 Tax=Babylonia areolata TaxID=304850 RepID=UPI003FD04EB3
MSRGQLSPDRPQQDSANKAQQKAERKLMDQVPEPLLSSEVNPPDHLPFQSQGKEPTDKQPTPPSSIILDVGGKKFRTTRDTLMKLPNTRLGRLVQEKGQLRKNSGMVEFFFDRNPKMMNSVLDLYRKGELHLPSNMCCSLVEEELRFWEIPVELMSSCCWKHLENHRSEKAVVSQMQKFLRVPFPEVVVKGAASWRLRLWGMLERPRSSLVSKVYSLIFFLFVFMAIFSFVFETDRQFREPTATFRESHLVAHNRTLDEAYYELPPVHFMAVTVPNEGLHTLRYVTFAFFFLDFALRLVTCPDRKQFFKQPRNWLEIVVAAKTLLHFLMEALVFSKETEHISDAEKSVSLVLYALSGVRVLRILYLANLFPGLKVVILTFTSSLRDLLLMTACVFCFVCLFGTMVYLAEVLSNLRTFPSVFQAMWWAIITMTTVGYGDVYPRSAAGKVVGSICASSGVVVLALPVAIIASNFTLFHDNFKSFWHRDAKKSPDDVSKQSASRPKF